MRFKSRLLLMATVCAVMVALAPAARADVITHGSTSITIDFVTVGDAGNAADTEVMGDSTTGYGSVANAYRIGKYGVTADQWAAVIAADANVGNAGSWSGLQPTAGTSWYEAAKFSNWLTSGNAATGVYSFTGPITSPTGVTIDRAAAETAYGTAYFIPTEDEWYKAAYYKGGGTSAGYWDYPTADSNLQGGSSPPDGIDSSGDPLFDFVFLDGYNPGAPNAASNAGDLSPYGTMGQGGNVWEWNETLVSGSARGMRGAYWFDVSYYLRASKRAWSDPTNEGNAVGFRVASNEAISGVVPEPGSVVMWVGLAVMGLIWWWRRK